MNQILEYSPNKSSGGGSSGSDKIVRIFAIILIVCALCFIGIGGYGALNKNKKVAEAGSTAPSQADISVETGETTAIIKVRHDKSIEKIIYSWDGDKETTDKVNGSSEREIEVQLPAGEHTLNVKVVDVDGVETSFKKTIVSENGADIINPEVKISVEQVDGEKKIRITATDETEIAYVTYKWNDEEEKRVEETDEDKKTIEFDIDILRGNNDLTIIAVDASNRTTTKTQSFAGVTKPEIKIIVAEDKKSIDVDCSHENGLAKITLAVNGQDVGDVDLGGETPTETSFHYDQFPEGNVSVKVTATSVDDTVTEATEEIVPDEDPEEHLNENIRINIERTDSPDKALVSVDYAEGIKSVVINVRDVDYAPELQDDTTTHLDLEPPISSGNNRITVTVIGANDTKNVKVEEIYVD